MNHEVQWRSQGGQPGQFPPPPKIFSKNFLLKSKGGTKVKKFLVKVWPPPKFFSGYATAYEIHEIPYHVQLEIIIGIWWTRLHQVDLGALQ